MIHDFQNNALNSSTNATKSVSADCQREYMCKVSWDLVKG